jgi:cytochrome P450
MTTTIADAVYFPPPLASRDSLPPREFAPQMRRNVLAAFSARAFEDEVLSRRLFGRVQLTLNCPEAIRHVLIDNAENYGRTVATVRLLYPIVGCGLFLAEGEDWKIQRRTVAPSFAPRTLPMLAHHRFLPGAAPPDRFAYLPFGIGPRVCIGAQFALTEATLVLARLVQAFEIRRANSRSVTPVAAITVRPDHPPPFHLRRR